MKKNPKIEICGFTAGQWVRIAATAVEDDRVAAKTAMLEAYPNLKSRYSPTDNNCQVLYLKNAVATLSSFTNPPKVIKF